jgi:RNA polymerase sigma-70 factor (ECF subfamily)
VPPDRWEEPDERLSRAGAQNVLLDAISRLPVRQREVIALRDISGWSAEETCNALGVSETNQRVLLHRARAKVRAALEDYFQEEQLVS